jgi:fumarylpyruvate hydrolase
VVWGYGSGLDMTRRDLQAKSKETRRPWSTSKDIEGGAVLGALTSAAGMGDLPGKRIHLEVNGETRQDATIADQVWSVEEIIADLSTLYHLAPGDLIMTGTPAGVGPVVAGDRLLGSVEGCAPVELTIGEAE